MAPSRRKFLQNAAAAATVASVPLSAAAANSSDALLDPDELLCRFDSLPGDKAVKIYAPARERERRLLIQSNSSSILFVASAIKAFVLCEALRQADSPEIVDVIERKELALNETVWSLGSPTFNPPNLTGVVSERTTLEAMITRSDNTATDMALKLVGANNVREFIAAAGLESTRIPDSTRAVFAYTFGAKNYKTITWGELVELVQGPIVHPFLNDVETLASSADDFVSYYSRALHGKFFKHTQTLQEFRRILSLCDFIYLVPLPLGVSAYAKSGNADSQGFHARSIAGGIFFSGRWVYFAFLINWYAADQNDPHTVNEFFSAIHHALTRVRDSLSR